MIARYLILLFTLLATLTHPAFCGDAGDASLQLKAPARVVQGFPVIFRFVAHGPQSVPFMSLNSSTTEIVLSFTDHNSPQKNYQIESSLDGILELTSEDGKIEKDGAYILRSIIKSGESLSTLLDIASLVGRGVTFGQIPTGDYTVVAEFPSSKIHTNPIQLSIVKASDSEKAFLEKANKVGHISRGWVAVCVNGADFSGLPYDSLGPDSKSQMGYHRLLCGLVFAKDKKDPALLEFAKTVEVPEYLKLEKELLMLELAWITNPATGKTSLLDFATRNPDMKQHVDSVLAGSGPIKIENTLLGK